MKTSLSALPFASLIRYSTLSALALTFVSPTMAIERPTPAKQPIEKNTAGPDTLPKVAEVADLKLTKHTYLGVFGEPITPALSSHLKLEKGNGIELELIAPNSPASKAALKKHDIILKIAGVDIRTMDDVRKVVTEKKSGDTVELQIVSEGKKLVKQVTLSERSIPKAARVQRPKRQEELGLFPDARDMLNMGLPEDLLEKFPEKDRERLMQLFKGDRFDQKVKELEKQLGGLKQRKPNIPQKQNAKMHFKGGFSSRVKMLDHHGSITLESTNDGKVIELKDKQGKTQYRGPYNNEIDKHSIPEELRGRVDNLDIDNQMKFFNRPKQK